MAIISITSLFAVMSDPANVPLSNAIENLYAHSHFQIRPGQWIIAHSGTAKELSDALDVTTGKTGPAVIVAISGYYGRASTQLWEWMANNMGKRLNG